MNKSAGSRQRALHQHDLNPAGVHRLLAITSPSVADLVWEPGAGTGAVTLALLSAGCRVTAIEIDPRRAAALRHAARAAGQIDRLTLVVDDLQRARLPTSERWRVIGNPPFMCTAALLRRLLIEADPLPDSITLLLHSEAAHKWTPPSGQGTHSGILAQICGTPRCVSNLPRDTTTPPSHVPLCLWTWRRHGQPPSQSKRLAVDQLLARAFAGPHTMREALRGIATGPILRRQGQQQGWHPNDHPRQLNASAWMELARFLLGIGRLDGPSPTRP